MNDRAMKYEAFLDELALVVDGDRDALERHADFLADDDEARDVRHDAMHVVEELAISGADYAPPADLEERLLAALSNAGEGSAEGRTTSPGFAAPDDAARAAAQRQDEVRPTREPSGSDEGEIRPTREPQSGSDLALQKTVEVASPVQQQEPARATGDVAKAQVETRQVPKSKGKRGVLLLCPIAAFGTIAAAAMVTLLVWPGADDSSSTQTTVAMGGIEGTLEHIARAADDGRTGVEVRRPGSDAFVALAAGERIAKGSTVRTDERTRASLSLSDGSRLVLNHATELEMIGETPRSFRLRDGEIVADIAHLDDAPHAFFHTPTGRVEVLGTKFELSSTERSTSVRVSRGAVSIASTDGTANEVREGEEGLLRTGAAPEVAPVTDLARTLSWSEIGEEVQAEEGDLLPGIGSLRARRPGERQDRERPLTVASQSVRVRIVGNVARTEVEQVFKNDDEHTLEGIYRFPLPPDAQIARLALDVEGRMEEGSFVERDRAAQIWRGVIRNATAPRERRNDEEFIWVPGPWRDPAILEWQRGGQFELRIFPIPARGERRVILAYTQTVAPQGGRRRYVYPLAHSNDGSTRVGRFDVDVRVAGAQEVQASGYQIASAAETDATRLSLNEESFLPKGDLVVEYALPGSESELAFWTYRGEAAVPPPADSREEDREVSDIQRQLSQDPRPYVAFALRPRLPRSTERRARDYVLIVDSSQSMVGERYDRASRLATHVVSEMDRRDRFTVLTCDYTCRSLSGGLRAPGAQAARDSAQWLGTIEPAGASDLVATLREAIASVSSERQEGRELHLVYFGDGVATAGYRRASSLSAETRGLVDAHHVVVSTVGVGGDADTLALSAMARASGGHYVPYVPGQRTTVAAMSVLETTYGVSLESPRVELPAGVSQSAPSELPTIRAGQEVVLVGRMDRDRVQGDVVLRGNVAGRPFEQRYRVDLVPTDAAGNRFVPRLWASAQIDELQLRGRGEERARIVATSKAFGVMSRHTSLLVLESEAMFRAFRVDRREGAPEWTGEEDVVGGTSVGALEVDGALGDDAADRGGMAGIGTRGRSAGGGSGAGEGAAAPAERMRRAPSRPMARAADELSSREEEGPATVQRAPVVSAQQPAAAPAGAPANTWSWPGMPAPQQSQPAVIVQPMPRPRGPGQWMHRVWYRAATIDPSDEPSSADREAARRALATLEANADSRDRHRDAVRALSRAGQLERALEVADAWIARDRQDAEALTAKADLLGRMGRRDESLRLLTGTVDLTPNSAPLHQRLAGAFERAGRAERACAHRIALAEIDESDGAALGAAMRCERALGREVAAERLMSSVREPSVRTAAERAASEQDDASAFRGDFTIDADWDERTDLDLSIVTPQGNRLSWMGGRTSVVGEHANDTRRERLGMRFSGAGTYTIEISRTDPSETNDVRGELRIRVLDQSRTVRFTMRDERTMVARVRITRESRLEAVTGTVPVR